MTNTLTTGNLPNLIIIGAMKSGTTSLHYYLNLHPDICMCRSKELDFFNKDENWHKGIEWYKSHFTEEAKIYGESSPNYTAFPKWTNTPQRMFSTIPETKLIYILREPIERIISHYVHRYAVGKENLKIEDALSDFDSNRYVARSKYYFQLSKYLEFFPASNLLVITSKELSASPQQVMNRIFQFLEVDTDFEFQFDVTKNAAEVLRFGSSITNSNFQYDTKLHDSARKRRMTISADSKTAKTLSKITKLLPIEIRDHVKKALYFPFSEKIKRPQISDDLRNRLLDYLAEDIEKLKEFTGYSFEEWNLK